MKLSVSERMTGVSEASDAVANGSVPLAKPSSPDLDDSLAAFESLTLIGKRPEAHFGSIMSGPVASKRSVERPGRVLGASNHAFEAPKRRGETSDTISEGRCTELRGSDSVFEATTLVFERCRGLSLDSTPATKAPDARGAAEPDEVAASEDPGATSPPTDAGQPRTRRDTCP